MKSRRTFLRLLATAPVIAVAATVTTRPIEQAAEKQDTGISFSPYCNDVTMRGTFAVTGATTASTAQALAALITDLRTHGILGT